MASYAEKVVAAASDGVRADKMIKQVFSSKQILAKIIKPIIPGLATMPDKEVQSRIEAINTEIPVSAYGNPEKITGSATEDRVVGEGNVNYDIRFHVLCPGNETSECQVLVDLEAQGDPNPGYPISYRATYYMARMISSQITSFSKKNKGKEYKNLKKVYTIWILFSPEGLEDSITRVTLTQESLYGKYKIRDDHLDLLNYYLVRVSNDGFLKGTDNELLNFLGTLLAPSLKADERVERLKKFIPNDPEFEKEAREMFGFTEVMVQSMAKDIRDEGRKEGRQEVLLRAVQTLMTTAGLSADKAMDAMAVPEEERESLREAMTGQAQPS